jgi:hypothetical protein
MARVSCSGGERLGCGWVVIGVLRQVDSALDQWSQADLIVPNFRAESVFRELIVRLGFCLNNNPAPTSSASHGCGERLTVAEQHSGAGILFLVVMAASYLPSQRAARVNPMVALRD